MYGSIRIILSNMADNGSPSAVLQNPDSSCGVQTHRFATKSWELGHSKDSPLTATRRRTLCYVRDRHNCHGRTTRMPLTSTSPSPTSLKLDSSRYPARSSLMAGVQMKPRIYCTLVSLGTRCVIRLNPLEACQRARVAIRCPIHGIRHPLS
jgi:hypothetical protein